MFSEGGWFSTYVLVGCFLLLFACFGKSLFAEQLIRRDIFLDAYVPLPG